MYYDGNSTRLDYHQNINMTHEYHSQEGTVTPRSMLMSTLIILIVAWISPIRSQK